MKESRKTTMYESRNQKPFYKSKKPTPTYYKVCPNCGATLDPGETCDCNKTQEGNNA